MSDLVDNALGCFYCNAAYGEPHKSNCLELVSLGINESELTRFRHGERVSDLDNNGQCNRCGNIVAKYGHEPWCVNGLYEAERDELTEAIDAVLDRERETADLAVKYEAERDAALAQLAEARALLVEDWDHSRFDAALYPDGSLRPFATQWTRDLYAFLWPEGKKP